MNQQTHFTTFDEYFLNRYKTLNGHLFRGHKLSEFKLIPLILRNENLILSPEDIDGITNSTQIAREFRDIKEFYDAANKSGLEVPLDKFIGQEAFFG